MSAQFLNLRGLNEHGFCGVTRQSSSFNFRNLLFFLGWCEVWAYAKVPRHEKNTKNDPKCAKKILEWEIPDSRLFHQCAKNVYRRGVEIITIKIRRANIWRKMSKSKKRRVRKQKQIYSSFSLLYVRKECMQCRRFWKRTRNGSVSFPAKKEGIFKKRLIVSFFAGGNTCVCLGIWNVHTFLRENLCCRRRSLQARWGGGFFFLSGIAKIHPGGTFHFPPLLLSFYHFFFEGRLLFSGASEAEERL